MDFELIFNVMIEKPWVAYTLLVIGLLFAGILLWRAKNGDEVSFMGLNLQSNTRVKELEQEIYQLEEEGKQKNYVITSLNRLASEISRSLVLQEPEFEDQRRRIYNYLLSCVVAVFAGNKGNNPKVCIFIDTGDGHLKVHEAAAHTPNGMRKLRLSIADSAAGYTFQTGETFFSGEIHTPGSRFKAHPKAQSTYHSLICAPIKSGDEVLGVLSVTGDEERSYTDDEKMYLAAFANVLAPLLQLELKQN
ncbi:GAF domain-containing protein [Desmospora activa]|uniref:GAF domain-containing protein n=1 Tax=Desmospora activa DSM 45169 TaxID=1121389 RepID=A0A2T4ZB56_9BACL|nr:GAF domain-containing protein [Desmospora activa]PTM59134.1 GAF domain-containing protein [Desmospora activa DSM 45169]